jgi:hypothetical protein
MLRWMLFCGTTAALGAAAMMSCSSKDDAPSGADAGCVPADSGVTAYVAHTTSTCHACLESTCPGSILACGEDCACDGVAVTALTCTAGLGAAAPAASQTACLAPLQTSNDVFVKAVGACVAACAGACGGVKSPGPCGDVDGGLAAHFGSGSGDCASCIDSKCGDPALACEEDCTCNATASTALDCLSGLGANATVAAMNACLRPLSTGVADSGALDLAQCISESCASSCGGVPDAGGDADTGDAGTPDAATGDAAMGDGGGGDAAIVDGASGDAPDDGG